MSLLLLLDGDAVVTPPSTGVLKVWDGTEWKKIGCGGEGFTAFTDNFNRANNTTSVGGTGWTTGPAYAGAPTPAAVWGIDNNKAYMASGANSGALLRDIGTGTYRMTVTLTRSDGTNAALGSDSGLILRYIDHDNYVAVSSNVVFRSLAGSYGAITNGASNLAGGDVLVATVTPTGLRILKNGTLWAEDVDSTHSTATRCGLFGSHLFSPATRYGDFTVQPVPGRLKLHDGTQWLREACDDDTIPAASSQTQQGWTITDFDFHDASQGVTPPGTTWGISYSGPSLSNAYGLLFDNSGRDPYLFEWGFGDSYTSFSVAIDGSGYGPQVDRIEIHYPGVALVFYPVEPATVIARPLKLWDGTTWQTVACMIPA